MLFTIGQAFQHLYLAGFLFLILAFPSGQLQTVLDHALSIATFGLVTVVQLAWLFVTDTRAGRLLAEVTELARSCGMDFVILFADDDRLYLRNGWTRAANPCSWLKINDHATLGLATAEDTGALMVKKIGQRTWPEGEVDLLGHLF